MIKLPEEISTCRIHYLKDKPLSEQILISDKSKSLINVRKVYTDGIYFGVKFTTIFHKTKTIFHEFRCKDRGFTEELVDNKDRFLEEYKSRLSSDKPMRVKSTHTSKKATFYEDYDLTFYYDSNNDYSFATITCENSLFRGLYGEPTEERYEKRLQSHSFALFCREPTPEEVKVHLINAAEVSYSNHITEVNTAYSDIRIEMF